MRARGARRFDPRHVRVRSIGNGIPEPADRLIVPQAPGSSSDTVARIVATELRRKLGQQVVVDNRPGGALLIGMELVARGAGRLHIGYAPIGALVISPNVVPKVPFDVRKDFQPLGQIATNQMLFAASPASGLRTVRDVIDFARSHPKSSRTHLRATARPVMSDWNSSR